jgi:uncharacterized protein YjbI with pentapeptide repeats
VANRAHLKLLKRGVSAWNAWRKAAGKDVKPNLSGANLDSLDLTGVDLHGADLSFTEMSETKLDQANLSDVKMLYGRLIVSSLRGANLTSAILGGSTFDFSDLADANLANTQLDFVSMHGVEFTGANLSGAFLNEAIFTNVDLSGTLGLEDCNHDGPSTIDHRTLRNSGPLPLAFLRGVGLPDSLIDYLPSLLNRAIEHYSCFISYSTQDQDFADLLHADLQNKGVRCWFAPHDLAIGEKIWDEIDAAIRLRDKVLLILSEYSITSDWVEDEVTKAFEEERKRDQIVLFPVRLDDAVMDTDEAWAAKLRTRHIGDFRQWKKLDGYKKSFERVLRDLTVKKVDRQP